MDERMDPAIVKKRAEYEARKARAKALRALTECAICGKKAKGPCKGCGSVAYCSTDCQRIDWRDRGHRQACKKIQNERAAEAARAEAATPPPSPPQPVFYGPAPRSHADEVRARIAAEHEAARARREANPEREPLSARFGSRCPICREDWDVNDYPVIRPCCCRSFCITCARKTMRDLCPFCRAPPPRDEAEELAHLRRHVENEVPEAMRQLAITYQRGGLGLLKSSKKAARLFKRAVELGDTEAMVKLGIMYHDGNGVKLNHVKAMQLFRAAADRGDARGQAMIALCLLKTASEALEDDLKTGFRYAKLSSDQGYTLGSLMLGKAYYFGLGVEERPDEVIRLFTIALASGELPEMNNSFMRRVIAELSA